MTARSCGKIIVLICGLLMFRNALSLLLKLECHSRVKSLGVQSQRQLLHPLLLRSLSSSSKMPSCTHVLFDFDGTLVNSIHRIIEVVDELIQKQNPSLRINEKIKGKSISFYFLLDFNFVARL